MSTNDNPGGRVETAAGVEGQGQRDAALLSLNTCAEPDTQRALRLRQAEWLERRFAMPRAYARLVAGLAFGEAIQ